MNIKTTVCVLLGFAAGYIIANQVAKRKAQKEAEKAPEEKSGADARCRCKGNGQPQRMSGKPTQAHWAGQTKHEVGGACVTGGGGAGTWGYSQGTGWVCMP